MNEGDEWGKEGRNAGRNKGINAWRKFTGRTRLNEMNEMKEMNETNDTNQTHKMNALIEIDVMNEWTELNWVELNWTKWNDME